MKSIIINTGLMLTVLCAVACNNQKQMNDNNDNKPPQTHNTPEEAAQQGKNDLLSALRSNRELNVGVDSATLQNAQPGKMVRQVAVSFDKLMSADSASSMEALMQGEKNTVVPLMANNTVATIVEVNKEGSAWRVAGLAGKKTATDLATLHKVVGDSGMQNVTIYEVPNLNVTVYGVRNADGELYYADYEGKLSIRQGVNAAALIPVLRRDAAEFQRKFGDLIKKGKLVK